MAPVRRYGMRGDAPSGKYIPDTTLGMLVGNNVQGTTEYTIHFPFQNLMHQSSAWEILSGSGAFDIDMQDRILSLSGDYILSKKLSENAPSDTMPLGGTYTIRMTGSANAQVRMSNGPSWLNDWQTIGQSTFTHTAGQNLYLRVRSADGLPASITGLEVLIPDFIEGQTFSQDWLDWQNTFSFNMLRFMNWDMINGSYTTHWEDRTTPDALGYMRQRGYNNPLIDLSGAMQGTIPYERMCELCNYFNADLYVCIPTRATLDYAEKMGALIRQHLRADLLVYLEYTNEPWNIIFYETHVWIGYLDATKRVATGTAGSPVLNSAGHGLTNGQTIVLIPHEHGEGNLGSSGMTFAEAVAVSGATANTFNLPFNVTSRHEILYWFPTSESSATITFTRKNHNYGARAVQLWDAFQAGFQDESRIIECIGGQSDYPAVALEAVSASGTNGRYDLCALSMYFSGQFQYTYGDSPARMAELDEANMAVMMGHLDTMIAGGITRFVAYEGGSHWVSFSTPSGTPEQRLAAIGAYEINPEMGTNINRWLRYCSNKNFLSFFYYIGDEGDFSQYGQFQFQRNRNDPLEPKALAVLAFNGYVARGEVEERFSPLYMLTFSDTNGTPAPEKLDFQFGSWEQRDGKLRGIGTRPPVEVAYSWLIGRDTRMSNGIMRVVINANGQFGDESGPMFRGIDEFNFLDVINLNGELLVANITNNSAGVLGFGVPITGYTNSSDILITVAAWGTRIVVWAGTQLTHDITSSEHLNGTIWGIKSSNGLAQTFDNLVLPSTYVDPITSANAYTSVHSMMSHIFVDPEDPDLYAPVSTYTDSLNWLPLIATASGTSLVFGGGQFGNVENHNGIWAENGVPASWSTETFTHYFAMTPNFAQANTQASEAPAYWGAELDEFAGRVLATGQNPEMLILQAAGYARFVTGATPVNDRNLTADEFTRWRAFARTTSYQWYANTIAAFVALRPNANFRIIPFELVFCDLVEADFMSTAVWTDFFGDSAPHGTETYYFLNALVVYRSMYGTDADLTGFTLPVGHNLIPEVSANIPAIIGLIKTRLDVCQNDAASLFKGMVY
jgi:hypothetical protein